MKQNSCCVLLAFLLLSSHAARAQFTIQDAHSTADLRGVHAVNDSVAWVSGTNGTVLRTEDGGAHWQQCATPPDAEKLDFRGVWAWNARHAEVMSAGPGELSRLFSTTDGCLHWRELARTHEKNGFWDSFAYATSASGEKKFGVLIGDPVNGRFETMTNSGAGWAISKASCEARPGEAAFAASNSSVVVFSAGEYLIVSGGVVGPRALAPFLGQRNGGCGAVALPLAIGESAGAFSVYFRDRKHGVVVGGDYKKPNESAGTAAFTSDGGRHWTASSKLPHGYRSAVTWDPLAKAWIAVGANGADISSDDGKTWKPLDEGNWNAISLPFAVGPKGRIGKLGALKQFAYGTTNFSVAWKGVTLPFLSSGLNLQSWSSRKRKFFGRPSVPVTGPELCTLPSSATKIRKVSTLPFATLGGNCGSARLIASFRASASLNSG